MELDSLQQLLGHRISMSVQSEKIRQLTKIFLVAYVIRYIMSIGDRKLPFFIFHPSEDQRFPGNIFLNAKRLKYNKVPRNIFFVHDKDFVCIKYKKKIQWSKI